MLINNVECNKDIQMYKNICGTTITKFKQHFIYFVFIYLHLLHVHTHTTLTWFLLISFENAFYVSSILDTEFRSKRLAKGKYLYYNVSTLSKLFYMQ